MTKVLVVDDSLSVRKVVERALAGRQIDVVCAASGSEALERLERDAPDFVVCDVVMPDRDGYEICEFIKGHPRLAHTPVLLMSGIVNDEVRERAARAQSVGILAKPFAADDLIRHLDGLLAQRPAASAKASAASWVVARSRASSSSTRRAWSCSTAWRPRGSSPWASPSRTCSARSVTMRGGRCPSWRGRCDVGRYRLSPLMRWLHALGVVVAYVVVTGVLVWLDRGDGGVAPAGTTVAVAFFYAVLSLLFLRRGSLARRLSWVGGACLTHVTLGLTAAAAFATLADLTTLSALAYAFARLGPAPFLTLVATPLVLAPFRGRVLSPRPAPRGDRARQRVVVTPTTPVETPVARDARRHEDPAEAATPVPAVKPSAAAPETPEWQESPESPPDDAVVRVRFERVAAQLPAAAFTLPLDRVAESLREPHWITVPRRVVLAQLPEGAVQVDWAIVASQFPSLAFAVTDVEFRRRYPGLKLTLPLDDVLRQLPRGAIPASGMPSQIAGLEAFPAPFQPLSVPREVPPESAPAPSLPPSVAVAAPPAAKPAPVFAPDPPMVAPPPPPPPPLPSPAPRIPVAAPAAAAPRREVSPEVVSRDALARLAACLAGAGTFDSWSGVVDNVPLVAFVSPNVLREPVAAAAACIAGLLGAAAGEQVTVRTARAAIIVTAAPTPVVIAARRPGAPVALLELRGARAAALVGRAGEGVALPPRALSLLAVEPRVAGLAGTLGAFGILEPAVLTDATGAARIYVFREPGREAEWLGELALAVWEGLGRARDADLGALVSVVFRQGRRRILVRSLGRRGTVLLAAAGPVAR